MNVPLISVKSVYKNHSTSQNVEVEFFQFHSACFDFNDILLNIFYVFHVIYVFDVRNVFTFKF